MAPSSHEHNRPPPPPLGHNAGASEHAGYSYQYSQTFPQTLPQTQSGSRPAPSPSHPSFLGSHPENMNGSNNTGAYYANATYPQPVPYYSPINQYNSYGAQSTQQYRSQSQYMPLTPNELPSTLSARPSTPGPHVPPRRVASPDLVRVARPYRSIIGSMSSGDVPSPGQLQNLLSSAFEGLQLLDPQAAQQVEQEGNISNEDIRVRKTRPRVGYMERPPQLTPPPQQTDHKIFNEELEPDDDKLKQPDAKRRRRDGAVEECTGCRSTTTPEWRRGPMGPRTLCNACGLVYAKLMNKKKQFDSARAQGHYISPEVLFADEANDGWGINMPSTPEESLALIQRVRRSVVGGGHPRRPRDDISTPNSTSSGSSHR